MDGKRGAIALWKEKGDRTLGKIRAIVLGEDKGDGFSPNPELTYNK
ncbi:hypothetical protein Q5692_18730 [Microcoleus sp. C2C3]